MPLTLKKLARRFPTTSTSNSRNIFKTRADSTANQLSTTGFIVASTLFLRTVVGNNSDRFKVQTKQVSATCFFLCFHGLIIISAARLRMLDVAAMRKLHKKVNLVPVIGKADSLTTAELSRFKSQVLQELKQYEIQVCLFSQLKTKRTEK